MGKHTKLEDNDVEDAELNSKFEQITSQIESKSKGDGDFFSVLSQMKGKNLKIEHSNQSKMLEKKRKHSEEKPSKQDKKAGSVKKERSKKNKEPLKAPRASRFPNATELFVKNIEISFSERELYSFFKDKLGDSVQYFELISGQKSKGMGYIGLSSLEEAQQVLNRETPLNCAEKPLRFSFSSRDRPKPEPKFPIFVGNLSFKATEQDLLEIFSEMNPTKPRIVTYKNGNSKGFGYVDFNSKEDHDAALKLNNTKLKGRELNIDSAIK